MILYILLILLIILSCSNKKTIENFTSNPGKAGSINDPNYGLSGIQLSNKVFDPQIYSMKNFTNNFNKPKKQRLKTKNKKLLYTTPDNDKKISDYLDSSQIKLNELVRKNIDEGRVKLSMLPIEQFYLEPEPKDDFILPFDKNIPQVVTRDKKNISNMCTGYWEDWVGKDDCTINTPCKKIYRKWSYNNLGDDKDHDCKTDRTGISNINRKIDLSDYRRTSFNIHDPNNYPSNIDVASCNQVINYSQKYDLDEGDICSNSGKCGTGEECICDNNSTNSNCSKRDGSPDERDVVIPDTTVTPTDAPTVTPTTVAPTITTIPINPSTERNIAKLKISSVIKLDANFDSIGTDTTSSSYKSFSLKFKQDMANLLNISPDEVKINNIKKGSIIVYFTIESNNITKDKLLDKFKDTGIPIAGSNTISKISESDITMPNNNRIVTSTNYNYNVYKPVSTNSDINYIFDKINEFLDGVYTYRIVIWIAIILLLFIVLFKKSKKKTEIQELENLLESSSK